MSRVHLGDVAIEHKETCKEDKSMYPIVGLEHLTPEQITLQNWDLNTENTFTKVFRKGNILFGRRRAYLKKAAVAPFDGICSGDITVIEAKEDKIIPELLPFVIQNDDLFDFAVGKSAGSLSPRVKWTHLQNYEFELPTKEKQRELAKALWAIEDTRKSYQELIKRTDELVKSQFIELFGDPISEKLYKTKTIGEIGEVFTGTTPSTKKEEYYENKDILFIKPGDISENKVCIVDKAENYISDKAKKVARIFPKGSVLVTCIGIIGKIGIAEYESSCNQQINVIVPSPTVDSTYLAYNLLLVRSNLQDAANAPVVPILNKTDFSKVEVMVPPYERQCEFATFVEQSDKSKFGKEMCDKWILEIKNLCCQMYLILRQ